MIPSLIIIIQFLFYQPFQKCLKELCLTKCTNTFIPITYFLYYNNQYGFRKKHSTELAILEIIDIIVQELDQSATPLNIYLDLSKAFYTIGHNILLHKLNYYGINCGAYLCKNYLYTHKQYVEVGRF